MAIEPIELYEYQPELEKSLLEQIDLPDEADPQNVFQLSRAVGNITLRSVNGQAEVLPLPLESIVNPELKLPIPTEEELKDFHPRTHETIRYLWANQGRKFKPYELYRLIDSPSRSTKSRCFSDLVRQLSDHEIGQDFHYEGATTVRKYWVGEAQDVLEDFPERAHKVIQFLWANQGQKFKPQELYPLIDGPSDTAKVNFWGSLAQQLIEHEIGKEFHSEGHAAAKRYWVGEIENKSERITSTLNTEPLDEKTTLNSLLEKDAFNQSLKRFSKHARPVLRHLSANIGQKFSAAELTGLIDAPNRLAAKQVWKRMFSRLKTHPLGRFINYEDNAHMRRYWMGEIIDTGIKTGPDGCLYIHNVLHPPARSIDDPKEQDEKISNVALSCKQIVLTARKQPLSQQQKQEFDYAYQWLEQAVSPTMNRIMRRYRGNERLDRNDFKQILREHLIDSILADYSIEKGPFTSFYAAVGWRRLGDIIHTNISQFTTPQRQLTGQKYAQATSVYSYDEEPSDLKNKDSVYHPENYIGDTTNDPGTLYEEALTEAERIASSKTFMKRVFHQASGFTHLEKLVLKETIINSNSFAEVCKLENRPINRENLKRLDNAAQRARKKLIIRLAEMGYTSSSL